MEKKIWLLCGWMLLLSGCGKERLVNDADVLYVPLTEYEKEVVVLVNKERLAAGLNALQIDSSLMVLCDVRTKGIVSNFSYAKRELSTESNCLSRSRRFIGMKNYLSMKGT